MNPFVLPTILSGIVAAILIGLTIYYSRKGEPDNKAYALSSKMSFNDKATVTLGVLATLATALTVALLIISAQGVG